MVPAIPCCFSTEYNSSARNGYCFQRITNKTETQPGATATELWKAQPCQRGRGKTWNPWVPWQAAFGIKPWLNQGQFSPTLNSNLLPWDRISVCSLSTFPQGRPRMRHKHWKSLGVVSMLCLGWMGDREWTFHGRATYFGYFLSLPALFH